MRLARAILSGVLLLVALTAGSAALPGTAMACSCLGPEPMAVHRGDSLKMIFAGTVATAGPAGVEVAVEQWFQGHGDPRVALSPQGFGDQGAACQEAVPPVDSRWIWVAFIPELGKPPQVNLCTPKARLDTPEGAGMLADVQRAFRSGSPPTRVPEAPATPAPSADPATFVLPLLGVALVAVVVFGAIGLFARGRSRGP